MKIGVRRARADEAPALTALSMRAKASNGYDAAFIAACRAELTVTPARMATAEFRVAESAAEPAGGAILGCVSLVAGEAPDAGEIGIFFVEPAFKRRGVGRELWEVARRAAAAKGWRSLRVDSDPAAVPFYRALGFEITGEAASGSIPGRVIPRMEIRLKS